jgi:hypothetical protein
MVISFYTLISNNSPRKDLYRIARARVLCQRRFIYSMSTDDQTRPASYNAGNASVHEETVSPLHRYNDPRADLHLVSSDNVVFKVRMHEFGRHR